MTRKSLYQEIQSVNQRLHVRQEKFHLINERAKVALIKNNPYLLIGTGLVAGAIAGNLDWHKAYKSAVSFYPLLIKIPRHLMAMSHD